MASINHLGNVSAYCPGCGGDTKSSFLWKPFEKHLGVVIVESGAADKATEYRLFSCSSCGQGALGVIVRPKSMRFPGSFHSLLQFMPESGRSAQLPATTQSGIAQEFREAELCLHVGCNRAAVAMFASALEKTLESHGFTEATLHAKIEAAYKANVLTAVHNEWGQNHIRVLRNDVLHEPRTSATEFSSEQASELQTFCQRIIEAFYAEPEITTAHLTKVGRIPIATGEKGP